MSALPLRMGHVALEPLSRGPEPTRDPAHLYLASLRPSGRRSQENALEVAAGYWSACTPWQFPWHLVRYEHVAALRALLALEYAPATVNRVLTAVRGVLRECWRLGTMPAEEYHRAIDVPGVSGRRLPSGRMLSAEELDALWEEAEPQEAAALVLLFRCGLRRQEVVDLQHEDVTVEGSTAWVRVRDGKGGAEREVPVRGRGVPPLLAWQLRAPPGPFLGLRSGRAVYRLLARLRERAGIAPCSPHDLRRSFVSHALASGADLATVGRMAGHLDPRTTARYDRRGRDAMEEVADGLDA